MQDYINPYEYHQTASLLRQFFLEQGFIEAYAQNRLSILAACEDPFNITSFEYLNHLWPLPQTNQMWLECELLKQPSLEKIFCFTTSYRQEKNPIPGRHNLIFPMFEFEAKGSFSDLLQTLKALCEYLGLGDLNEFKEISYAQASQELNVDQIDDDAEEALAKKYGDVVLLHHFPFKTSPFWNMKYDFQNGVAYKVDALVHGMETIGAAERSTNPQEMRDVFYTISDGQYAQNLFQRFGKQRVEKELDAFLNFDFFERFGGGIGMTRLIRALKQHGILKPSEERQKAS